MASSHDYLHPDDAAASLSSSSIGTGTPQAISARRRVRYEYSEAQRRWAVTLYAATTTLLFADQNLLSPNLSAAADEFGFDDETRDKKLGGHIALAFWLLGAPAAFLVGCLADVLPRAPLFAITVCIGEGSCLATYFTTTYEQLFLTRALTGISVGGALPLIASVLGDLYEAKDRSAVMAAVGIGTGIGIALGQGIAGFLGPIYGWRLPFLIVSVPAIVCALLVLFTVRDPERGGNEEAFLQNSGRFEMDEMVINDNEVPLGDKIRSLSKGEPINIGGDSFREEYDDEVRSEVSSESTAPYTTCEQCMMHAVDGQAWGAQLQTLRMLLRCKSVALILLQGAPGCLPWGVVNSYLNDYLHSNRGMTVEKATSVILVFGFGNFLGLILGGTAGSLLYRRGPRIPPVFAGVMAIVGCFPMWLMINVVYESTSVPVVTTISVLAGLCSGVTGPIVKSTLTNVTLPNTRGQAFALQTIFDDVGRGLGPVFVAMLISNFGGRTAAFNIAVFGWVVCGVFNLLLYFTVERDETDVQSRFAGSLQRTCATDITGRQNNALSPNEQEEVADPLLCTKRRRHDTCSELLQTQGGVV